MESFSLKRYEDFAQANHGLVQLPRGTIASSLLDLVSDSFQAILCLITQKNQSSSSSSSNNNQKFGF